MAATLVIKWSMAQVTNCSRPIQPRESACGNQACQTWACKKLTTGDESFLEVVSMHHAKKELLLLIQVEDPHGEATAANNELDVWMRAASLFANLISSVKDC